MAEDDHDLLLSLGYRIRQARLEQGFSQQQLAAAVHCDRSYISLIERDQRMPGGPLLLNIIRALQLDPVQFLAIARQGHVIVRSYMDEYPATEERVTRLFLQARDARFRAWDRVLRQYVLPLLQNTQEDGQKL